MALIWWVYVRLEVFDAEVNRLFHNLVLVYHQIGILCVEIDQDGQCKDSVIVAVKQNNMLATAFHPELTSDLRWYVTLSSPHITLDWEWFIDFSSLLNIKN